MNLLNVFRPRKPVMPIDALLRENEITAFIQKFVLDDIHGLEGIIVIKVRKTEIHSDQIGLSKAEILGVLDMVHHDTDHKGYMG